MSRDVKLTMEHVKMEKGAQSALTEAAVRAVRSGDLEALRGCEDVLSNSVGGRSPLHIAAECGQVEMIGWLVRERGAQLDWRDAVAADTPLHRAALEGSVEAVRLLLALKATPDLENEYLHSPLWYALAHDKKRCVVELLVGGADLGKVRRDISIPAWAQSVADAVGERRTRCRSACVTLLGMRRKPSLLPQWVGRDVLRLVAHHVWATRLGSVWGAIPQVPE